MLKSALPLAAIVVISLGCSNKDKDKCDEALRVTRQSLQVENTALASQWRERAYTYCDEAATLQALDAEIVKTNSDIQQRRTAEETRKAEGNQLISLFIDWAGKHRTSGNTAVAAPVCRGPEDTKQRFCDGQRKVGDKYTLTATYWEEDPEAVQFKTRLPHGFDCGALGEHKIIKSWNVEATKRAYCDITSGPLAGLKAVMSWVPAESEAKVFSAKYLEKDANLKAQLGQ
jgi:hypothetical protein